MDKTISLAHSVERIAYRKKLNAIRYPLSAIICIFCLLPFAFAQETDLEFTIDLLANTAALPNVFRPNIDLGGRGFYEDWGWPQNLAHPAVLESWQKDIGFNSIFRLQYNLWEISSLGKNKELESKLRENYENIIKKISDAGGIVILDIFGTPAGLGKVLDKTSAPADFKAFKDLVKGLIKDLNCNKRYNIWYEAWSAPDSDNFFLGRKQEYFNLYRALAEAAKELEAETKIHIPVGGPAVTWWFQNLEGNTIITPENSLIYELIKFCSRNHLPLDFISWHAYSSDPKIEAELTSYNKTAAALIREWLSYFNFDKNTPLIIDEWNFDSAASNILPQRQEASYITASYIASRLKNMAEAGIDYQLYFSLEDFHDNKEGIDRNTGIFWFTPDKSEYKGGNKSIYNVFRMLSFLGNNIFLLPGKPGDRFVGVIPTKSQERIAIIVYNYIDPDSAINYLSRNIATLNASERKTFFNFMESQKIEKIIRKETDISKLRLTNKIKVLFKKAQELYAEAEKFKDSKRNTKINIKNLKENYLYQRYVIDSSCSVNCEFIPQQEKIIEKQDLYQEELILSPYSVNLILLRAVSTPEVREAPEAKTSDKNE